LIKKWIKNLLTILKDDGGHDIVSTLVAVHQEDGGLFSIESALGEPLLGGGVDLHLLGLLAAFQPEINFKCTGKNVCVFYPV